MSIKPDPDSEDVMERIAARHGQSFAEHLLAVTEPTSRALREAYGPLRIEDDSPATDREGSPS